MVGGIRPAKLINLFGEISEDVMTSRFHNYVLQKILVREVAGQRQASPNCLKNLLLDSNFGFVWSEF